MGWKETMKQLKHEDLKRRAPDFYERSGGLRMKTIPYSDTTSNGLTKCILHYIRFKGGDGQRINTQGQLRNINGRMKWVRSGSRSGCADIHAVIRGRAVSIEVKIGRDKLSTAQEMEKQRIERAGGLYFIARDMDSFIEFYEQNFEL
jgi:hypothetical protein